MDSEQERLIAGRYRLLAPLGAGGMGTVWRAQDEVLGREVAIKEVTFPRGITADERTVLRERTRREARAAAQLSHPSAVTVYDVVEHDDAPYLVMELVEARTLSDVVRTDGALSPQRTAQVGLALLGALEAAHRQGIVHRDVKPSNVMLREDGRVVLTDFGIATTTGDASITHTGLLLGSPAYIAPERARGEVPGPPSDLWSLGATLFTAVEGSPPYDGGEPLITVTAVVTGEHAPFVAAGPLEQLLEGLLEKDPARRLDAAQARGLLEGVADDEAADVATTAVAPMAAQKTNRTSALDLGEVRAGIAAGTAAAQPAAASAEAPAPALGRAAAPLLDRPQRPLPPPPGPAADRQDGGRPRWLVPGAVAGVLLATTAAGVAMTRDDDPGGTTASPSASPTAPGPSSATPESSAPSTAPSAAPSSPPPSSAAPSAAAGSADVPAGWSTSIGDAGWTVALPPGYQQTRSGEYRQASTGRTLRIETGPGRPDAVEDRREQAQSFEERNPSYEEIRIEAADYRGYEAADWEFTYEGLHVINRVFVVDGTGHSLFFQTKAADFAEAREDFDGIAAAFQPVGG